MEPVRPRRRVEVNFKPPDGAPTAAEASESGGLWISSEPLTASSSQPPQESYELSSDCKELFVGCNLPPRRGKAIVKAVCQARGGKPMQDSQTIAAETNWVEFSFLRPAQGWPREPQRIDVSLRSKPLGSAQIHFKRPPETPSGAPGEVFLHHQPDRDEVLLTYPGETSKILLRAHSGRSKPGTTFSATWTAREVPGFESGRVLRQSTQRLSDPDSAWFVFSIWPEGPKFAPGLYSVELRVNDKLAWAREFRIERSP